MATPAPSIACMGQALRGHQTCCRQPHFPTWLQHHHATASPCHITTMPQHHHATASPCRTSAHPWHRLELTWHRCALTSGQHLYVLLASTQIRAQLWSTLMLASTQTCAHLRPALLLASAGPGSTRGLGMAALSRIVTAASPWAFDSCWWQFPRRCSIADAAASQ